MTAAPALLRSSPRVSWAPLFSASLTEVNSATRISIFSGSLRNGGVATVEQIRRENLVVLLEGETERGVWAELADKLGKSPAQVSQWANASKDSKSGKPRSISTRTAREIERKLGKPEGWMDRPHKAGGDFHGASAVEKGAVFEALSSEERELIDHWRHLLGKDRRAKLAEIAALSAERLAEREELFEMAGVNRIAERAADASRTRAASTRVELGPKLKQQSLFEPTKDR